MAVPTLFDIWGFVAVPISPLTHLSYPSLLCPSLPPVEPTLLGAPRPLRSVPDGKLFEVSAGDDVVPVVHLWGTPHEMGVAHGQLQTEPITTM